MISSAPRNGIHVMTERTGNRIIVASPACPEEPWVA
jgi:hypothetical protein